MIPLFYLKAEYRDLRNSPNRVFISSFVPANQVKSDEIPFACIALKIPPVLHGKIEQPPYSLGELHDQLYRRGSSFITLLSNLICDLAGKQGIAKTKENYTLIVLYIPLIRAESMEPEIFEVKGFWAYSSLGEIGVKCGKLFELDQRYQHYVEVIESGKDISQKWRDIKIEPIECLPSFTSSYAQKISGDNFSGATWCSCWCWLSW